MPTVSSGCINAIPEINDLATLKKRVHSVRLAIEDHCTSSPEKYPHGKEYLAKVTAFERLVNSEEFQLDLKDQQVIKALHLFASTSRDALLANPLLDNASILLIKRKPSSNPRLAQGGRYSLGQYLGLPRQSSWQQDTIPKTDGWVNKIAVLSNLREGGSLETLFTPPSPRLVGDIDLDFSANKVLFSMPNNAGHWNLYEIDAQGKGLRRITPDKDLPDVHHFDGCYLPDGRIAFASTAALQGVPCNTTVTTATAYRIDADGKNMRQLCFDQDHNYCLTVANDGRLMYLRWEYTDIPHVWGRYMFTMNPDGTNQRILYGSGSYWPNSTFYARPIPGSSTKFVGIVTGHHVGRVGEMILFDTALGRNSTRGVVHRFPDVETEVQPDIEDRLTIDSWPKFLHPFPLSGKYFLATAKPTPDSLWGIYLVDNFGNMTLLHEEENHALLEPIMLQPRKRPPLIPDRVNPDLQTGVLHIEDIYAGPGLKDVPRGSVKELRLVTYHFAYRHIAGITHRVGADGPWEPKRILGTVPVNEDGSAIFRVPANTPISLQPIDAQGRALQLMRSWTTTRPGELASCTGCHEHQSTAPPVMSHTGARSMPATIKPWQGPTRGFSFRREVQPILDHYCVSCHNGDKDGEAAPDLRADQGRYYALKSGNPKLFEVNTAHTTHQEQVKKFGGVFDPSYIELRRYVRVGGFESDIRQLSPGEFLADTSELVQILQKGHHGVRLDHEAWERIYAWIDLNAPCHGTWAETAGRHMTQRDHPERMRLRRLYTEVAFEDPELVPNKYTPVNTGTPAQQKKSSSEKEQLTTAPDLPEWPFNTAEAKKRQLEAAVNNKIRRTLDLGDGVTMEMALVPAGRFIMGSSNSPGLQHIVTIKRPFWMSVKEVTNAQFARYNPKHDSRYEHKGSWSFSEEHLGWPLNKPRQPVIRVSQKEAFEFCRWLSGQSKAKCLLPTAEQWEYAARAGAATPFFFGKADSDFSKHANMADATMLQLAYDTDGRHTADLVPRDDRYNDGVLVTAPVGSYRPNAWGLHDMHGNVWEWTSSYSVTSDATFKRVITRGGSWYDRPKRCSSDFALDYPVWLKVYNVGFRVIAEVESP